MKTKLNGIEVNYEIHGKEGAPWLTFSHSLACSLRMWDPQVAAFQDRFRILLYDTRGHGGSEAPKGAYTLDMLGEDLRQLLAELKIKRTHYVGLSMGGMIGQVVALTDPGVFDRVVLADTGHTQTPETKKQWEERINTARDPRHAAAGAADARALVHQGFYGQTHREKDRRAHRLDAGAGLRRLLPRDLEPEYHRPPERHPQPGAGHHRRAGCRGTGNALHRRERAGSPAGGDCAGAAHIANIEQAEAFNRALAEFLSSPASGRA